MADDYRRIELITGEARRRHCTTEQKLQIIEKSFHGVVVVRRPGVAPNFLYRWRLLGKAERRRWDRKCGSATARRRVRDLERLLGRTTTEVDILKEALAQPEAVAEAIGVPRSHLLDRCIVRRSRASHIANPRTTPGAVGRRLVDTAIAG